MSIGTTATVSPNVHVRDLFSLKDRVALVTGGAGRYGRQICRALGESGATVIVASRNYDRCADFADELSSQGHEADALPLDLLNEESVLDVAGKIQSNYGKLDVLFNNAVMVKAEPMDEHADADWAQAVGENSVPLYRACRIFGALMANRGAGSIVNIASIYGIVSPDFRIYEGHSEMTNPPSYGFVKAGMIQLTRYLAVYFAARGVRVNCISPGGLFSPSMPVPFVEKYAERTPMGRMAGPNDLKGAAVFLASDASAYVTGQNLIVDGGYTAW
ncbi:MAG TPA: SDR family oxidoreductase [Candidatus Acidoferrales bacterium]|nr:SDR family oxidoreductase [Candidatus Acidoferrales bacterium]